MKKLLFLAFCVPLLVVAQKKKNGTIYIEHPAIDIVKDLDMAFITGDSEKIKSLVTEDFKFYNGLSTNFVNNKGAGTSVLIRNSKYWSDKLDDFKISTPLSFKKYFAFSILLILFPKFDPIPI